MTTPRPTTAPGNTMPVGTKRPLRRRQRGVALIAVTVSLAILGVIVVEFTTNTNVDMYAAHNAELDMKAHFLAMSGMNLAELVIHVQRRIDNGLNKKGGYDIQLADYVGLFMGAFGGGKEEVNALAELAGGRAADDIQGLGVPEGRFDLQMTTEDKKINLNCANGSDDEKNTSTSSYSTCSIPRRTTRSSRTKTARAGAATARPRSRRSSTISTRTATSLNSKRA
ncbi:MAG: hypothetical protein MJE77_46880 [Proteobacteria bacterium]|nr:hypothetical protein [Pseudomonadota bacterium]